MGNNYKYLASIGMADGIKKRNPETQTIKPKNNETGSRSLCMRPRSDPPKMKNSMPDKIVAEKTKTKKTKRIGW